MEKSKIIFFVADNIKWVKKIKKNMEKSDNIKWVKKNKENYGKIENNFSRLFYWIYIIT